MSALRRTVHRGLDPLAAGLGYELRRLPRRLRLYDGTEFVDRSQGYSKIQYGCFQNVLPGWVNVDLCSPRKALNGRDDPDVVFFTVDLTRRHPFPDDVFEYAFGEDFLEHLTQADALIFLSEALRTLRPGGVLRLSFPGLEGILNAVYRSADYDDMVDAKEMAYDQHEHHHFFSQAEIRTVALHLGYRDVTFCDFRQSTHPILRELETRDHQTHVNTYVELTK